MPEKTTYNIYCDESFVDNPSANYMVIGALFIKRQAVPEIREKINELRKEFFINGELKWVKTSSKTLSIYEKLFKYMFSLPIETLSYKAICVEKKMVDYKKYHKEDKELAFYKFYYQLLKTRIEADNKYYIFLDFKPTRNKNSVRRLGEFLSMVSSDKPIKHIQAYDSKDNIFIQLADVITGAVGASKNIKEHSGNKSELISIIAKSIGKPDLNFCSRAADKRFNIFCIIPGLKH